MEISCINFTNQNMSKNKKVSNNDDCFEKILEHKTSFKNIDRNSVSQKEKALKSKDDIEDNSHEIMLNKDKRNVVSKESDNNCKNKIKHKEDDSIKKIAEILDIDVEEIQSILNTLNLKVGDLADFKNVNKFIQTYLKLDSELDIMNVPDLMPKMKQINNLANEFKQQNIIDSDKNNIIDNELTNEILTDEKSNTNSNTNQEFSNDNDGNVNKQNNIKDNARENVDGNRTNDNEFSLKEGQSQTIFDSKLFNNADKINTNKITNNEQLQQLLKNDVVNQVVDKIKVNISNDMQEMTVQLKPDSLGKLSFTLTSNEGVITAHFITENQNVKEAIESNLTNLKFTLQQQGINVDKMEVGVAENNYFANQDDQRQSKDSRQKNKKNAKVIIDRLNKMDELDLTEQIEEQTVLDGQNKEHSIDYSA